MTPPHTAKPQRAFLSPPPGLLQTAKAELEEVLASPLHKPKWQPSVHEVQGRLLVEDLDLKLLLELALRLRCVRDLVWVSDLGLIREEAVLDAKLAAFPWAFVLAPQARVECKSESTASRLYHEGMLRARLQGAVGKLGYQVKSGVGADRTGSPDDADPDGDVADSMDAGNGTQTAFLRFFRDRAQLEFSLAGGPLYRRGYRARLAGRAPLPEHVAAGLVRELRRHAGARVPAALPTQEERRDGDDARAHAWYVPFAGTGTLGFEAALLEIPIPNGVWRPLACAAWNLTPRTTWDFLNSKLAKRAAEETCQVHFCERNPGSASELGESLARFQGACTGAEFTLREGDFFHEALPSAARGKDLLMPLNPPYGDRLRASAQDDTPALFGRIGRRCAALAAAHDAALHVLALCPDEASWRQFGNGTGLSKDAIRTFHISHGGRDLRCALVTFVN